MKLIDRSWTIPIALCLLGAAFADELTTSGDAKSLGFSARVWRGSRRGYQARFDSFSPSDALYLAPSRRNRKGRQAAYLQAIDFKTAQDDSDERRIPFLIASMSKR